jgi:hypothetical protein
MKPNPAASVDAPLASSLSFVALCRRATDQRRWALGKVPWYHLGTLNAVPCKER